MINMTPVPTDEKNTDFSTGRFMCPTCNKQLNNVPSVVCLIPTGNVFCSQCMDNVIKKDMICPLSNLSFEEGDILQLQAEGSSFAGRSGNALEAVKHTPAPRL